MWHASFSSFFQLSGSCSKLKVAELEYEAELDWEGGPIWVTCGMGDEGSSIFVKGTEFIVHHNDERDTFYIH